MRSMIVEDDTVSRKILHKMLAPFGECVMAADAVTALDHFMRRLKSAERFDLICCDIVMPVMDGHELLSKVRSAEKHAQVSDLHTVKIIMTSSASTPENVRMAMKEGRCESFLVKPVDRSRLYKELVNLKLITALDVARERD